MLILVIGTPDSGKSQFAENLAMKLFENRKKAYVATMIPFGEEGRRRVEKHRMLREGKGFITFERGTHLEELIPQFKEKDIADTLVECMSNLVGNEMHNEAHEGLSLDNLTDIIVSEVISLYECCLNMIVVTNTFSGDFDDEDTRRYIELQNKVNEKLMALVDEYYIKENEEWIKHENN